MLTKAKLREGGRKRWEGVSAAERAEWSRRANVARWKDATPEDKDRAVAMMAAGKADKLLQRKGKQKRLKRVKISP